MVDARCTAHRAVHVIAHHLLACLVASTAAAQSPQPTIFLNINPSWSPDGRQLVFESARRGNTTLYIINADGTGERRLTSTGRGDDTHPQWSPDGRIILFDSDRDGAFHLYTIRPDGTGEQRLTVRDTSSALTVARHPSWSPDGRRIVFDSDRDGNGDIYVMDADGRNVHRLRSIPRATVMPHGHRTARASSSAPRVPATATSGPCARTGPINVPSSRTRGRTRARSTLPTAGASRSSRTVKETRASTPPRPTAQT